MVDKNCFFLIVAQAGTINEQGEIMSEEAVKSMVENCPLQNLVYHHNLKAAILDIDVPVDFKMEGFVKAWHKEFVDGREVIVYDEFTMTSMSICDAENKDDPNIEVNLTK